MPRYLCMTDTIYQDISLGIGHTRFRQNQEYDLPYEIPPEKNRHMKRIDLPRVPPAKVIEASYDNLSKPELVAVAREKGVKDPDRMSKNDILVSLRLLNTKKEDAE
jgi:hypothetical protein